jgi:hypothetical protein
MFMKVMRDIQRSGQDAGEVIQQVSDTVFPMYKAFIEPCLSRAHIRVTNSFNPFAGFKEPIQILKTEEHVSVDVVVECMREMFPGQSITQVPPSASDWSDMTLSVVWLLWCLYRFGTVLVVNDPHTNCTAGNTARARPLSPLSMVLKCTTP